MSIAFLISLLTKTITQTKAKRCDFNANKEERIKGVRSSEERRNLKSKLSLTLKIATESIRTYEATIKDNTRFKALCETKDGIVHEIVAKNKRQVHKMWKKSPEKKQDCYAKQKMSRPSSF